MDKVDLTMFNSASVGEPLGLYSHGARIKPQELLFVAGQLSFDRDGSLVGKGDVRAQLRQIFSNMGAVLGDAGGTFGNVVAFTTYLTSADAIPAFMEVRQELFAHYYPGGAYPPNTLLVVSRLVREECLAEISAVAAL